MCSEKQEVMEKTYTVKARIHYGSKSLDITIPAELVKKHSINPGDIFKVEATEEGNLVLMYERVFENK